MPKTGVKIGVNVNTRAVLILDKYDAGNVLRLAETVEELGYGSVWVGDSLLSKFRLDPLVTLGAIAGRTKKVQIGTAALILPLRNPVHVARDWATLDLLAQGRTLFGVCVGKGDDASTGPSEYAVSGVSAQDRGAIMFEQLDVIKRLWTEERIDYSGRYFHYKDLSVEPRPFRNPYPPMYLVGWPYRKGTNPDLRSRMEMRVAKFADGFMIAGGISPEEYRDGLEKLKTAARESGRNPDGWDTAWQATVTIGSERERAVNEGQWFLGRYYGREFPAEFFGPMGPEDHIIARLEKFIEAGVRHIILRFAAQDQFDQLEKFTRRILPSFQ